MKLNFGIINKHIKIKKPKRFFKEDWVLILDRNRKIIGKIVDEIRPGYCDGVYKLKVYRKNGKPVCNNIFLVRSHEDLFLLENKMSYNEQCIKCR